MNLGSITPYFGTAMGAADMLMNRGRGAQPPPAPVAWADPDRPSTDGSKSPFNIEGIKSQIGAKRGLYRPNLFSVRIYGPPKISAFMPAGGGMGVPGDYGDVITFFSNSASLPGVQIITSDHRRQNMGTFDRRPFGVQVTDIPITFFVDNKGFIIDYFQAWANLIVYYSGSSEHADNHRNFGQQLFEVGYRKDYLCRIEIATFSPDGRKILVYKLEEAFPIQIGDISVAWADTDSFSVLPIQFTFRTYSMSTMPIKSAIAPRAQAEPEELGPDPFGPPGYAAIDMSKTRHVPARTHPSTNQPWDYPARDAAGRDY